MNLSFNYVMHYGAHWCGAQVPVSPYASLTAALVCGHELPSGAERELLSDCGLIHWLVVSGAQLHFVERLLNWAPRRVRLMMLGVYAWLSGFGLPVLRALLRRLLPDRARGWSSLQLEAIVTVILLLAHPPWLLSRSFTMSWLGALALRAPLNWPRWSDLRAALKIYLFLFPFSLASPLSVAWNALIGPWIGRLLLPICMLSCVTAAASPLADFLWRILLEILRAGPAAPPLSVGSTTAGFWLLPVILHSLLLWGEWQWRRASAFCS
jgi:hypothetical protein